MNLSKTSKGALVISGVALLICCAMLLGTTWAWFTDEVTSAHNLIQAGTLKIDLIHETDAGDVSIKDKNDAGVDYKVFDYDLWEPGYTQVETLKIVNEGSLALKYRLSLLAYNVDPAAQYKLADVIDVYMLPGKVDAKATTWADMKDAGKYVGTLTSLIADVDGAAYGILLPETTTANVELPTELQALLPVSGEDHEVEVTLALHMREEAGNEYQNLSVGDLYLNLVATQLTYEIDSFDNQYDKEALYAITEPVIASEVEATVADDNDPLYPAGTAYTGFNKVQFDGDAGITVDTSRQLGVYECAFDVDGNAITMTVAPSGAVFVQNSDFVIDEGEYILDASQVPGGVYQIFFLNCTVNGEPLVQENLNQYLINVNWAQAVQY